MASPRLIVVYAGYGDTLLLEYDDKDNPGKKGYWLIDGGPLTSRPGTAAWSGTRSGSSSSAGTSKGRKRKNTPTPNKDAVLEFAGSNAYQAYYQFLQQTLIRYCRSKNDSIDLLKGILVTHPHSDHMDGIVQFVADYISNPSPRYKLDFKGPIVVNGDFIPPDAPGKSRYATLWTLLKDNKFKTKKIADRGQVAKDDSIPTQMFNICPGKSIWELWKGSGTSVPPTKDDKPKNGRGATYSRNGGKGSASPIITTGDSIGQNILEAFKGLKVSKDPSFGIFKVPHHGSRRNSQPNEKYQADLSDSEKQEYRFLCILCWGLRGYKPPPLGEEKKWPPDQQFSKEAMAYKEQRQILQKVINDFPKDNKLIQEIGDNIVEFFEAKWIQQRPSENPERSEAGFINALDTLWKALRLYLANGGFKSGKLDLKLDLDLWRLGVLLAGRYSSYSEACYIGDNNQITSCRKVNIVLKIEPIFNFASFIKSKQFVEVMKAQYPSNGEPVLKKAKAPAVPAQVRDLYEALSIDPISIIRFRQGILEFYRKFK